MFPTAQPPMSAARAAMLCIAAAVAAVFVAYGYWAHQQQIQIYGGYGWDGRDYAYMYDTAAGQTPNQFETAPTPPFCKRVGLPQLAASLPFVHGFKFINIASGLIAAIAVFAASIRTVGLVRAAAVTAPLLFYLNSPIRFPDYYPWIIDPPAEALMALAMLALSYRRIEIAVALLVVGAPFKETCFYFAIVAIACYALYSPRSLKVRAIVSVVGLIAAFASASLYKIDYPNCGGGAFGVILDQARHFLTDPWRMLTVVASVLCVAGPFLLNYKLNDYIRITRLHPALWFGGVSFFLSIAMSAAGGSDSGRIFFVSYPTFVPVLLFGLSRLSIAETVGLSFFGLTINRWLSQIPQPADMDNIPAAPTAVLQWFSDTSTPLVATQILLSYLAVYVLLGCWNPERTVAAVAELLPTASGKPSFLTRVMDWAAKMVKRPDDAATASPVGATPI